MPELEPGTRVVIRTPDRREFRGVLVNLRGNDAAVIKLDTGWLTSYPLVLITPEQPQGPNAPDRSSGQQTN